LLQKRTIGRLSGAHVAVGEQFGGGHQRLQFDIVLGEILPGPFLPVDDHEHALDRRARFAERVDRVDCALAGGRDVLEDDDLLALREFTFYLVAGTVLFGLLADDDVGVAGLDAGRRRQGHRTEGNAREFRLADPLGEGLGDERERLGVGFEDVLVDVVLAGAAVGELELPESNRLSLPESVDERLRVHVGG
jgi:hypothetical protein